MLQLRDGILKAARGATCSERSYASRAARPWGPRSPISLSAAQLRRIPILPRGKLVAMLADTPEVVSCRVQASVDGTLQGSSHLPWPVRPVRPTSSLCFIGTTSLYGRRPNQYDRLSMPAEMVGGPVYQAIRYEHIQGDADSRTQGVGTFHFRHVR